MNKKGDFTHDVKQKPNPGLTWISAVVKTVKISTLPLLETVPGVLSPEFLRKPWKRSICLGRIL